MDDIWITIRSINFALLFAAFMVAVYKGILKSITHRKAFYWDRFLNLCWIVLSLYALGEIFYISDIPGGPRVLFSTAVILLQLWIVFFKYGQPKQAEPRYPIQSHE